MLSKIFSSSVSEPILPETYEIDLFDDGPSLNLDLISQFRPQVTSEDRLVDEYYDYLMQKFTRDTAEE